MKRISLFISLFVISASSFSGIKPNPLNEQMGYSFFEFVPATNDPYYGGVYEYFTSLCDNPYSKDIDHIEITTYKNVGSQFEKELAKGENHYVSSFHFNRNGKLVNYKFVYPQPVKWVNYTCTNANFIYNNQSKLIKVEQNNKGLGHVRIWNSYTYSNGKLSSSISNYQNKQEKIYTSKGAFTRIDANTSKVIFTPCHAYDKIQTAYFTNGKITKLVGPLGYRVTEFLFNKKGYITEKIEKVKWSDDTNAIISTIIEYNEYDDIVKITTTVSSDSLSTKTVTLEYEYFENSDSNSVADGNHLWSRRKIKVIGYNGKSEYILQECKYYTNNAEIIDSANQ